MTHQPIPTLITILGPTASGKTTLAVNLANSLQGEIISADSRQVYQHMDLGTGKDIEEYGSIPYHLIDIIDPQDEYNLFKFTQDFCHSFLDIIERQKQPLLVGGTGMYLDSVLNRYNLTIANIDKNTRQDLEKKTEEELSEILKQIKPLQHNTTDSFQKERLIRAIEIAVEEDNPSKQIHWPVFNELTIGIKIPRNQLKRRISERLKYRFQLGMIEEVENLINIGVSKERIDNFGLEYRYILKHITGELNYNDMFQKLNSAIFKFSKQQEKWFRNIENKGVKIHWLDFEDNINAKALDLAKQNLSFIESNPTLQF
jgi:tRNA dimethylallyltransferase